MPGNLINKVWPLVRYIYTFSLSSSSTLQIHTAEWQRNESRMTVECRINIISQMWDTWKNCHLGLQFFHVAHIRETTLFHCHSAAIPLYVFAVYTLIYRLASSYIFNENGNWNDISNDWMLSIQFSFYCILKEKLAKKMSLIQSNTTYK